MFYRQYANKLTKVKKISKKMYIKSEVIDSKNDLRKFWILMNPLMPERINSDLQKF